MTLLSSPFRASVQGFRPKSELPPFLFTGDCPFGRTEESLFAAPPSDSALPFGTPFMYGYPFVLAALKKGYF